MGSFFRRLVLVGVGVVAMPLSCSSGDGDGSGSDAGDDGSSSNNSSTASNAGSATTTTGGIDIDDDDGDNVIDVNGEPCAAEVSTADLVPIDIHIMLDSSASMLDLSSEVTSKWDAVVDSLIEFVEDPATADIGVGLQYFPLLRAGTNLNCMTDDDCMGDGGPCSSSTCVVQGSVDGIGDYLGINETTTVGICDGDSSCADGEVCRSFLGVCTAPDPNTGESVVLGNGDDLLVCETASDCPVGNCELLGYCEYLDAGGQPIICSAVTVACPMGAGICRQYPYSCMNSTLCGGEDYATPAVEISAAADRNQALVASLTAHAPEGLTPTAPALSGAIQHAQEREAADPNRKVVAVLVTDGLPTECEPVGIAEVADVARAGVEGTPSVETYVIGVFTEAEAAQAEANLNQIASAGGTDQAFVITTSTNVPTLFLRALNEIRGAALSCNFEIPEPEAGATLDFGQVNLEFVDADGNKRQLVNVAGESACGDAQGTGWYYVRDADTDQPTQITVCPDVCDEFESAMGASQVNLQIGCATIIK